ncbi:MAG: phosphate/phosphite/phosphonate ABC transporter substrate-binding protein [Gammaproteobacteria bacterium]|nr:phosphate/phosphite/phosphonate ABC transporter substrate-binding protein [Gammaproteobacteria bacterium]
MCTSSASRIRSLAALLLVGFGCLSGPLQASDDSTVIRLAIISLAPPSKIYKQWKPFADYLSAQSGRQVELVVPKGFKKIREAVENKSVDIFYVNSHIFYRLKSAGQALPVAQMINLDGTSTSKSVLFVRNDSGINKLSDLKGEKVAFVAPMGAGGYLAPRAEFYQHGIKTTSETNEEFTKNLSTSIHKVLIGDVKAGTMCGLNFRLMSKRMETGDLKIISETDKYPENVFGARNDLDSKLRQQIITIITGMSETDSGKLILKDMQDMKILDFVTYDEKIEDITRDLMTQAEIK